MTTVSGKQTPLTVRLALRYGSTRAKFLQRALRATQDARDPTDAREEMATAALRTETASAVTSKRTQRRAISNVDA